MIPSDQNWCLVSAALVFWDSTQMIKGSLILMTFSLIPEAEQCRPFPRVGVGGGKANMVERRHGSRVVALATLPAVHAKS